MAYTPFIAKAIENLPVEAKVIRKLYKVMKDAGKPIVEVWDKEVYTPVTNRTELMEIVFDLDECYLFTKDKSWVRLALGNEWDVIVDYSINLESELEPVNQWIEKNES